MANAIQQANSHMNDETERLSRRVAKLEALDIGQRVDSVIKVKRNEINDDVALAHTAPRVRPQHFLIETPVPSTRDIRNYVDELEELITDTRDVCDLAKVNQDRITDLEESLEGLTERVRISEAAVEDSNLKYKTLLDYQGARTFSAPSADQATATARQPPPAVPAQQQTSWASQLPALAQPLAPCL